MKQHIQFLKMLKLNKNSDEGTRMLSDYIQHQAKGRNISKKIDNDADFEVTSAITNMHEHRKSKKNGYDFIMADQEQEFDYFKIQVICVILCQPKFFMYKLLKKDPREMYLRAKGMDQQQFRPDNQINAL